jgi:hypothetical protein
MTNKDGSLKCVLGRPDTIDFGVIGVMEILLLKIQVNVPLAFTL